MSLKSFDKFCEDLILKGPGREKIIYDERQKIMQMNIGVETLIIFGGLAVLNCFFMEMFYQYAESYTMPLVLMMLLCAYYYNFRCAAKDCLIGINGVRSLKYSSASGIFVGIMMALRYIFKERETYFPIVEGQVSNDFLFLIAVIFVIVYGITMLILVRHVEKKKSAR